MMCFIVFYMTDLILLFLFVLMLLYFPISWEEGSGHFPYVKRFTLYCYALVIINYALLMLS